MGLAVFISHTGGRGGGGGGGGTKQGIIFEATISNFGIYYS